MVQNAARDVSDSFDPIWERQNDTGREQKDGTDERVAGGGGGGLQYLSLSLCAVVEVRAVGTCTMYHTLIPAPRRGMTCENGRPRQPARRPATE